MHSLNLTDFAERQSSGSTRLVLHVTNLHRGTMALEPTSRYRRNSTDAIGVTKRSPLPVMTFNVAVTTLPPAERCSSQGNW
jgi:hypothetical protein